MPSPPPLTPQTSPADIGEWSVKFDWTDQVDDSMSGGHLEEIAHAALLTSGRYAGHVLFWTYWDGPQLSRFWLLNPQQPDDLLELTQTLASNIFCSGHTFAPDGRLYVVGGWPPGGASPPTHDGAYYFDPNLLGSTTMSGPFPTVSGNPWVPASTMQESRYYPSIVQLRDDPIPLPGSGSLGPDALLVLGGPPDTDDTIGGFGTPWWEILVADWQTQVGAPIPWRSLHHLATPPSGSTPDEQYELAVDLASPIPPDPDLDSYPRGLQLENGAIYLAGEVDTVNQGATSTPYFPPNLETEAWSITPRAGQDPWKLWRARSMAVGRHYGSAVLIHDLGQADRVLVLGGGSIVPGGGDYDPQSSVQELLDNNAEPRLRTWATKTPLAIDRMYLNAVVLPTREILITGGASGSSSNGPPAYRPELYNPGDFQFSGGSTALMAEPPLYPDPADPALPHEPTPRLYHHVSVLLRDGRVLVAGGNQRVQEGIPLTPWSFWTGEIFSPPYLFRGERPVITLADARGYFNDGGTSEKLRVDVTLEVTDTLQKVVLLRPASVTHHFDADQRYIELDYSLLPTSFAGPSHAYLDLEVTTPSWELGPSGRYLLFVVSAKAGSEPLQDRLVPSIATGVHLQR